MVTGSVEGIFRDAEGWGRSVYTVGHVWRWLSEPTLSEPLHVAGAQGQCRQLTGPADGE